jgi:fatty-acyl-CoA synthase
MTETSPAGLANAPKSRHPILPAAASASAAVAAKQGRPIYGMEFAICDDEGQKVAHDDAAFGGILVCGPWVAASYYREVPTRIPARAAGLISALSSR